MFMVKLADGSMVYRLDDGPTAGEEIVAAYVVDRPPVLGEAFDEVDGGYAPMRPEAIEPQLLALIDAQRDRLYSASLPQNDGRRDEYLNKTIEAYSDAGPWPILRQLAEQNGTTVDDERWAVMEQRDLAEAWRGNLLGVVRAAKEAVRSAPDTESKLLVYQSVPWPTPEVDMNVTGSLPA